MHQDATIVLNKFIQRLSLSPTCAREDPLLPPPQMTKIQNARYIAFVIDLELVDLVQCKFCKQDHHETCWDCGTGAVLTV